MINAIQILEKEHGLINAALQKLLSEKKDYPVDTVLLKKLEELVLNHIAREDVEIYNSLKRIAKLAPQAVQFLNLSHLDLESIKISAIVFFEKYKDAGTEKSCKGFQKDLERLTENIGKRITFEDEKLFPFLTNLWAKL
jgi:hemerythrin-like domain-containing protein